MSLDNLEVIDAVGTEKDGNTVVLTVFDAWDWNDKKAPIGFAIQA